MATIIDMATRPGVFLVISFSDSNQRFLLSIHCPKLQKRIFYVPATMEEFGKTIVTDCEHWHTSSVIYARYYEAIEEKQIMEAVRMAPATNFFNPFEYFACVFNDIKYAFDVEKCEMAAKRALMRRKNKESILFEIYFSSDDDPVEFHYAQEQSTSAQWTAAFFKDLKKPSICLKKTSGFVKRGMSIVMSKL